MEAVAHSPSFAKKAGVSQSVGQDFSEADKGKKFSKGGDMKKMAKGGDTTMQKMAKVRTAAPSKDGLAERGKTKARMPKMAGNMIGTGSAPKAKAKK